MDTLSDTDLGITAEDFYESQLADRTGPVELGRRLAAISSPSTFPPEQYKTGDPLEVTNQSINANAINTLASKMMLTGLPPGQAGWKFIPREDKIDPEIKQDPEMYGQVLYALSRREEMHRVRLEATQARAAITKYYKLLLLTGNSACLWLEIDNPVIYNMHNYVVKRDAGGVPLVGVIKVSVSRMVADQDIIDAVDFHKAKAEPGSNPWDDEITIFHCQKLVVREGGKKEYVYWQEVEGGHVVEGTEAVTDFDTPTIHFGGMIPEYGSNWFLPYCQDYEGDMMAVENFSAALQDGGAAAARFLTLVDPNGTTEIKDILEADNLDVVPGREQDVKTLRSDKGADLAVTSQECEKAVKRLGQAFLMFSSVQRTGERVTAEEWRILAQEIDQAMGGLWSAVAQTSQKYFVLRFIMMHEEVEDIGKLPEGLVRTSIITGIDSLSQSSEASRLREGMAEAKEVLGDALAQFINPTGYLRRLFAYKTVKTDGLVKDDNQVAADTAQQKQEAMQKTLLEKATGPLAQGGADMIGKMVEQGNVPEGVMQNGQ